MKAQRGYTLVEMMITIGLIGILSAIANYAWQGYQDNTNLRTAAREVMSDIASCKQRAMGEGVNYCLQFADGSADYSLNATSCIAPTKTEAKSLTNFGAGLTVSDTNFTLDRVIFLPRGTLFSNTGTITLTNAKGSTALITINITGRANVLFTIQ